MMRNLNRYWTATTLVALALAAASCIGGDVDSGDSSDVILAVREVTIPAISGAQDPLTGDCTFVISDASATLTNTPKTDIVTDEVLQSVVLETVTLSYVWDDGVPFPSRTLSVGSTIPPGGTGTVRFPMFAGGDLNPPAPPRDGHTASVSMVFTGHTFAGDAVTARSGGVATINACAPDSDSDGIPNILDNCPNDPNPTQQDSDADGVGDPCDTDTNTP